MTAIHSGIEPPANHEPDDDPPTIRVTTILHETDDTLRSTAIDLPATATDADIATALLDTTRALGPLRGPALTTAINHTLRHHT